MTGKKARTNFTVLQEIYHKCKDTGGSKEARMVILTSDKAQFQIKSAVRDKLEHVIMIKVSKIPTD